MGQATESIMGKVMAEVNCGNCKHWEKHVFDITVEEESYPVDQYGRCQKILQHQSGDSFYVDPEAIDLGLLPAYTEDGSDYKAELKTLPTFSCNLHEAKANG